MVEDLVMVLVLVFLPVIVGIANTDIRASAIGDIGWLLALTLGKLIAFVALVFLVGTRVINQCPCLTPLTGGYEQ